MLPYIHIPTVSLGPITLQVWGLMVSLGILLTLYIAGRILKERGIRNEPLISLAFWAVIFAFLGARFFHIFFYEPKFFLAHPFEIFKIWHGGFSSFGGFIGGGAAGIVYIRKNKLPQAEYVAAILTAMPWGWAIGRIGCFLSHLHPGKLTNSILGVRFPGGARYELGFIEMLNGISAGLVILIARRFIKKDGIAPMFGVAWYAIVRFFTDFLRATDIPEADARYLGLTPAQYGAILLCVGATFILFRSSRARA